MASLIVTAEAGVDLFATVRRISDGTPGLWWNNTSQAWETNPSDPDKKITLTNGTGISAGTWTGGFSALGTYSGQVMIQIHDTNWGSLPVASKEVRLIVGEIFEHLTVASADGDTIGYGVQDWIDTHGGITASNMRGTDNAFLAASWVAPDNTNIVNAATDAALAKTAAQTAATDAGLAKTAAQSADGKLPADTTTKINRLDATISSRSSHSTSDIYTYIQAQGGLTSANMRGTDAAFLAANWVAPNNTGIGNAAADAALAKTAAQTVETRLTATRAGYLDNLSGGAVATQAAVTNIQNTTRTKFFGPAEQQIPATGTTTVRFNIMLFDTSGNMEAPDSLPTVTAANQAGTDRSANLGTVTNISTGHYRVDYTVADTHAQEEIILTASIVEGGVTLKDIATMNVVTLVSGSGFTSADRTKLETMYNKLPSRTYLVGTDAADGDLNLDNCDGSKAAFMANVSALATTAGLAAMESHGDSTWATATGFLATNDARLNNLDATISSRSTFAPGGTVALQSDITALQSHGDSDWATATGFLATNDSRLNYIDVAISSRSDFNEATDQVTLAAGHGLATLANQTAIKAKTDNLPAIPAAQGDIPSAGQVATSVDSTLTSAHGSGSWVGGGGDATEAKQDTILAQIAAMTPTPVAAGVVSAGRTWTLHSSTEGLIAANIIQIGSGSVVTLAMDFADVLNEDSTIATVVSAVADEGDAVITSDLAPNGTRTKAHITFTVSIPDQRSRVKVTITTSDGQVIVGRGWLETI